MVFLHTNRLTAGRARAPTTAETRAGAPVCRRYIWRILYAPTICVKCFVAVNEQPSLDPCVFGPFAANYTGGAGVSFGHLHLDSSQCGFIGEKSDYLPEGPGVQLLIVLRSPIFCLCEYLLIHR